jgi:hypothetical protein
LLSILARIAEIFRKEREKKIPFSSHQAILDKLYITVQSFPLIISAGVLAWNIFAIFHDVYILKMPEKKACYLAHSLPATAEERTWRNQVSKAGGPPAKITDRQ